MYEQHGSVDMVMSSFGISIFPDQDKTWSSARRVLTDGGIIVATAWDVQSDNVRWFDASRLLPTKLPRQLAYDPAKLVARLKSLGFRDAVVYKTSHSSIIPSADELIDAMVQNPGVASYLMVLGEGCFRAVMLECINEGYHSVFTGDSVSEKRNMRRPVVVSNSSFVVVATK